MSDRSLSLIICTYNRPIALRSLLESITRQALLPSTVIIVDGSTNDESRAVVSGFDRSLNIRYILVSHEKRGLTRQRNVGLMHVPDHDQIVAFLDDDVILEPDYFVELEKTFESHPEAIGVGGYISNEVKWEFVGPRYHPRYNEFCMDGWKRREQTRMIARKWLGLYPTVYPGRTSPSAHSLSLGYLPPSGLLYPVDFLIGCSMAFQKRLFNEMKFSEFFEGYGLYEDMDLSLRASRIGQLLVDTKARLLHYHEPSSRPNLFRYGFMVVRNGWYVWRVGNTSPKLAHKAKWWSITLFLLLARLFSVVTGPKRFQAFTETMGRVWGMLAVILKRPVVD